MSKVTSKDGTKIAFEASGQGSALILVGGAFQHRLIDPHTAQLASILEKNLTVIHYDRRGRGDSTDTQPYSVEREIEDIEALIDQAGGSAFVFGMSSGAALAMEAAIALPNKIRKLAMYEPPYNSEEAAGQAWKDYRRKLNELLAEGCRGDAVALFMKYVGMPAEQIPAMRQQPMWPMLETVAPTLAYDAAVLGEDASVPTERAAKVSVPALIMDGGASYPFMHITAVALANAIPDAEHRTLEGQTHEVDPQVLATVLEQFFAS